MTLDAAADCLHAARASADPGVLPALAIAAVAAATLAGAWFFQLVLDIRPCPLCLEQRYAYYLAVPLAFWSRSPPPAARRGRCCWPAFAVLLLAALANAWLGGYHAGVEWKFWQGPTDCSGPVVDLGSAGNLLERLDTVKVVRCDEVQWRFLGLSLAGYNVLISLLMALIAAWGSVFETRRESRCGKAHLRLADATNNPTGKSLPGKNLSSPLSQKYSACLVGQITSTIPAITARR